MGLLAHRAYQGAFRLPQIQQDVPPQMGNVPDQAKPIVAKMKSDISTVVGNAQGDARAAAQTAAGSPTPKNTFEQQMDQSRTRAEAAAKAAVDAAYASLIDLGQQVPALQTAIVDITNFLESVASTVLAYLAQCFKDLVDQFETMLQTGIAGVLGWIAAKFPPVITWIEQAFKPQATAATNP